MIELEARVSIPDAVRELLGVTSSGELHSCSSSLVGPCMGRSNACGECCARHIRKHDPKCETCEKTCENLMKAMQRKGIL